jgi:hypothetical protein
MMNDIQWNTIIIQCENQQSIKPATELCAKNRIGKIIVPAEHIENTMLGRVMLKANFQILTTVENKNQKQPGSDKLMGMPSEVFDAEGFEISPMKTDNPALLLNDLRQCSEFLKSNLNQQITIGWDLSHHTLKDQETLDLLEMIAKGYRPNYIRFGAEQGLICTIAKKACATKTVLPHGTDVESDYKVLEATTAIKAVK